MKKQPLIVIDPSALLAVLLNERSRGDLERRTKGCLLVAPGCIQWEMGNALYGALKRKRVTLDEAHRVFDEFESLPIQILDVNIHSAVEIAAMNGIPAYDAYYLQCASQYGCPLLTLDQRMTDVARDIGVTVV